MTCGLTCRRAYPRLSRAAWIRTGGSAPEPADADLRVAPRVATLTSLARTSRAPVRMMRLRRAALLLVALSSSAGVLASCSGTDRSTLPKPPPTTAKPSCTVSALLVPSCGAWLGASTPSKDGTFDYAVGLDEYEAVAQNEPDIQHFYKRNEEPFPNDEEIALAER